MKARIVFAAVACAIAVLSATVGRAAPILTQEWVYGMNTASGGDTSLTFINNLDSYMMTGVPVGDRNVTPSAVVPVGSVLIARHMVQSNWAYSWDAQVNPTGAFASQNGSVAVSAIKVDGNGVQVRPTNVQFNRTSTTSLIRTRSGSFGTGVFGPGSIGFYKGPDGILWTSDDVRATGNDNQLVDGFIHIGLNVAAEVGIEYFNPGQEVFDQYVAGINGHQVTMTYNLKDDSGTVIASSSRTMSIATTVPEPGGLALVAFAALCMKRRR